MDLLFPLISFVLCFGVVTLEVGANKYPKTFPVLFNVGMFYLYGVTYGLLAVLFYYLLINGIPIELPDDLKLSKNWIACLASGFSLRGLLNINLFEYKAEKFNLSIGTGILTNYVLDKVLLDAVKDNHDAYLIRYMDKVVGNDLSHQHVDTIKTGLVKQLAFYYSNEEVYKLEIAAFKKDLENQQNLFDMLKLFTMKYGFRKLKHYVKSCKK